MEPAGAVTSGQGSRAVRILQECIRQLIGPEIDTALTVFSVEMLNEIVSRIHSGEKKNSGLFYIYKNMLTISIIKYLQNFKIPF